MSEMHKIWMTKKVEVLKEEIEQREFSNTMETWSRNRARVEEEINRRQESYRFSSQTGTRIHTRPPSATIRGASSLSNSRPGSARARSATPTTSSTPRPGLPTPAVLHRRQTPRKPVVSAPGSRDGKENGDDAGNRGVRRRGIRREEEEEEEMIRKRAEEQEEEAVSLKPRLFSSTRADPPKNIRLTPYSNEELMQSMSQRQHSMGLVAEDEEVEPEQQGGDSTLKGFKTPHHDLAPNIREYTGGELSIDEIVQRFSDAAIKAGARRTDAATILEASIADQFFTSKLPPSTMRQTQMAECDEIKQRLACKNVPVSLATIQKAILLPEDHLYEDCISKLPSFKSRLMLDPTRSATAGLKSGKRAKRGKKGKKGKKRGTKR